MSKIPSKPKKWLKYPSNIKNDWNDIVTEEVTEIPIEHLVDL